MRTLHKRSFMPAAIGATAIAWIARVLSGRLVADRGDRSDSGDYMRTSLKHARFLDVDGNWKRTFHMSGQWCLPDFCTNHL